MTDPIRAGEAGILAIAEAEAGVVDRMGAFPHRLIDAMKSARLMVSPEHSNDPRAAWVQEIRFCRSLAERCGTSALVMAMHWSTLQYIQVCGRDRSSATDWVRLIDDQPLVASSTTEFGNNGDISRSGVRLTTTDGVFTAFKRTPICSYLEEADALFFLCVVGPAEDAPVAAAFLRKGEYESRRLSDWDAVGMRGACSHAFSINVRTERDPVIRVDARETLRSHLSPITHIYWASVWSGILAAMIADLEAMETPEEDLGPIRRSAAEQEARIERMNARAQSLCFENATFSLRDFHDFNRLKIDCSEASSLMAADLYSLSGARNYAHRDNPCWRRLRELLSARFMIPNNRLEKSIRPLGLLLESAAS